MTHDSAPQASVSVAPSAASDRRPEVILGIDPGLNRTGYAVLSRGPKGPCLREAGVIRSTAKKPLAERLAEIGQGLAEVCEQYRPEALALEQVFSSGQFPQSALLMAHARGVILYVVARYTSQVVHYAPRQMKRLLTGSGNAAKEQVQRAVQSELGLPAILEPNDVADAVAIALCHYHSVRLPMACLDQ
ncbi:MAG: crossover junction endodeoxyribonuclease RuvC [Planctomycetaceae bacterium]